jgi:8-oxo-dGTP pyrophosphatase MutT (NUDIX family)
MSELPESGTIDRAPKGWPASCAPSWGYVTGHDQPMVETWLFKLRRERYLSRISAKQHDFFVAEIADAVHVIASDAEGRVLMVRQFRVGSRTDSLETPGGLIDPGEETLAAALRELREETGYEGQNARCIGAFWSLPSLGTSRIWTVIVDNVEKVGEPHGDPTEELQLEWVPRGDVAALIASGDIHHGCVISGLLLWLAGISLPGAGQ